MLVMPVVLVMPESRVPAAQPGGRVGALCFGPCSGSSGFGMATGPRLGRSPARRCADEAA
jgi:hypothetical protein